MFKSSTRQYALAESFPLGAMAGLLAVGASLVFTSYHYRVKPVPFHFGSLVQEFVEILLEKCKAVRQ